jgi:tight adherence protein C
MDFSFFLPFLNSQTFLLAAIGVGTMLGVIGIGRALTEKSAAAERMSPKNRVSVMRPASGILSNEQKNSALSKSLTPNSVEERFAVQLALAKAGFRGSNAVAGYYLTRLLLGLGLPVAMLVTLAFARMPTAPGWLAASLGGLSVIPMTQMVCVLCAIGFFGPSFWLRSKINERRLAIEEAFPNALDLIQIAVEAGLGFDQALMHVSSEIHSVAPDLAEEIIAAENEIQAGRDRERALLQMARRTGIDQVSSFVNVVLQSARFGTPMSEALSTYAEEMRVSRELKAQEKANKLPVLMSAVMASLMLPAILMLTLGPVVIRYVHYFASNPTGG